MQQRIITGLILLALALVSILALPTAWFAGLVGLVVALAAYEWQRLVLRDPLAGAVYVVAVLLAGGVVFLVAFPDAAGWVAGAGVALWLGLLGGLLRFRRRTPATRPGAWRLALGLLVLPIMWYAIVRVHHAPDGVWLLLYGMALVWVADSLAYFVGRYLGQRRLAPAISPGKTLEGLMGGLAGVALVSAVGALLPIFGTASSAMLALWSALVALLSVAGDLEESRLKREAGVKDSGRLLPGHGGVLDRIDGQVAAMPVWLLALWQMNLLGGPA
ncbi:MAG: phosphatidate cytidylyltransferase [Halothiobacillaceae bacterium]